MMQRKLANKGHILKVLINLQLFAIRPTQMVNMSLMMSPRTGITNQRSMWPQQQMLKHHWAYYMHWEICWQLLNCCWTLAQSVASETCQTSFKSFPYRSCLKSIVKQTSWLHSCCIESSHPRTPLMQIIWQNNQAWMAKTG